jgi:hypothetical protein
MARKHKGVNSKNVHEFTRQIHSTERRGTRFAGADNWNEKKAKEENWLACKDCRYFWGGFEGCWEYVGLWHKACDEFEWS